MLTEFRQHNKDRMANVAFTPEAYRYYMKDTTIAVPDLPRLVYITSKWDPHVVLERLPSSPPEVAVRKPKWQDALAKEMRQCHADIPDNDHVHHAWWVEFNESLQQIAEPSTLWHNALCPPTVNAAAVEVMPAAAEPEDDFSYAPYAPVMRSGTSIGASTLQVAETAGLSELVTSSFALISVDQNVAAGEKPFPLACCLVQLPSSFPEGVDTKHPGAEISLSWWWPSDETYAGRWVPWLVGTVQSKSTEFRGTLLVVDVQVKNAIYSQGTRLRDRKAYLTAVSLRMIPP